MRQQFAAILSALLAGCVSAQGGRSLDDFEQALAAQDSATAALTEWCDRYDIASPARVVARPAGVSPQGDLEAVRATLEVGPDEALGFRHVLLACGDTVLSDALNWYVPGRLTAEMNRTLETTEEPFGRVVAPLGFTRQRLAALRGAGGACPPDTILTHQAVLRGPDDLPISLVVECYTAANLRPGTAG